MDLGHPREMTQNTTHRHTLAGNINSIKVSSQECWGMLMFGAEATQLCGTKVTKKQSSWRGEGTHWYTLYTGVAPITPLAMTSPTTTCNKHEIQPNEYGTYVYMCGLFSIHKWLPDIFVSGVGLQKSSDNPRFVSIGGGSVWLQNSRTRLTRLREIAWNREVTVFQTSWYSTNEG